MDHHKESLSDLLHRAIPIKEYRGVIVEKVSLGYKVLGKVVKDQEAVDAIIDESKNKLKKSITSNENS